MAVLLYQWFVSIRDFLGLGPSYTVRTPTYTKLVLDDLAAYWNEGAYSELHFSQLQDCFGKWGDTQLEDAQNAAWLGMINYYQGNVATRSDDPWVNCLADPDNSDCTNRFVEG